MYVLCFKNFKFLKRESNTLGRLFPDNVITTTSLLLTVCMHTMGWLVFLVLSVHVCMYV